MHEITTERLFAARKYQNPLCVNCGEMKSNHAVTGRCYDRLAEYNTSPYMDCFFKELKLVQTEGWKSDGLMVGYNK